MGVRHRLTAGNDALADIVGQRLRRHLPGQHRHHLARNLRHQRFGELAAIGIGGNDKRTAGYLALGGFDDPAIIAAFKTLDRRTCIDVGAETAHGARQTTRQRKRIDVAAGPVPEAAKPCLRAQHVARLFARQQFNGSTELRPLPHASFGDLDAAGRMHRLNPSGLFSLCVDLVTPGHVEEIRSAVAQHADKTFSGFAVFCDNILRIGPRQRRDHLAVVASRRTPARLRGFDDRHIDAGLAQMQRGGEAGEAGADDDDVGLFAAHKLRQFRPRRCHRGPQRVRHADVRG